jgi:hypothetical protein
VLILDKEVLRLYHAITPTRFLDRGDEYAQLIGFLLARGCDPNVYRENVGWNCRGESSGTTFDQFAVSLRLRAKHKHAAEISRDLIIFKRLEEAGAEYSKPINTLAKYYPRFLSSLFMAEVEELTVFEEQIERKLFSGISPTLLH